MYFLTFLTITLEWTITQQNTQFQMNAKISPLCSLNQALAIWPFDQMWAQMGSNRMFYPKFITIPAMWTAPICQWIMLELKFFKMWYSKHLGYVQFWLRTTIDRSGISVVSHPLWQSDGRLVQRKATPIVRSTFHCSSSYRTVSQSLCVRNQNVCCIQLFSYLLYKSYSFK